MGAHAADFEQNTHVPTVYYIDTNHSKCSQCLCIIFINEVRMYNALVSQ